MSEALSSVFAAALLIVRREYPDLDETAAWAVWSESGCGLCPPALAVIVFDCAVHFGIARAIRCLQEGLEVPVSEEIDETTRKALAGIVDEATAIAGAHGARIAFTTELAVWSSFGKWPRRLAVLPYEAARIAASLGALGPV